MNHFELRTNTWREKECDKKQVQMKYVSEFTRLVYASGFQVVGVTIN